MTAEAAILIRTFNEERHLGPLLDALDNQARRGFEVIIVDSGSVDGTLAIAEARADRVVRLDSRDFTFGYSLNAGIAATSAPLVAIVSAHTLPITVDWLANMLRPFEHPEVAMVYGGQRGVPESRYAELRDFERTYADSLRTHRAPAFFANNANSAIRRELWQQHRFDEHLPGLEDIAWARYWVERGKEVAYQPDAAIYHIHDESWAQVHNRYYREAVAARRIGVKSRADALPDTVREVTLGVADLLSALKEGQLGRRAGEIVRYRYHKGAGHVRGLLDKAAEQDRRVAASYFERAQRAVRVRGAGAVGVELVDMPTVKPGDVLIKVAFAGMCGTDLEIVDGTLGYYSSGMASYPITPGHEFSGRVVSAGANAGKWEAGTPVVVECIQGCGACDACRRGNPIGCDQRAEVGVIRRDGGFADYVVSPSRFVRPLPPEASLRSAVLCEPIAVVLKGLRRLAPTWEDGRGLRGRRCAVVGGGPIGLIAANVLALRGNEVTLFERDPARRAQFSPSVAHLEQLSRFDAVIEATGSAEALDQVLAGSAADARILLLGLPYGPRPFSFESIVAYDKIVIGSVGSAGEDFAEAIQLLPSLRLDSLTAHGVPFASFAEALYQARERRHPKVILEIDPSLEKQASAAAPLVSSHLQHVVGAV
jgi:threonine dehydrogenase-like Zn-dependent dehydrogenase/GT2 family glycosyltransferase